MVNDLLMNVCIMSIVMESALQLLTSIFNEAQLRSESQQQKSRFYGFNSRTSDSILDKILNAVAIDRCIKIDPALKVKTTTVL